MRQLETTRNSDRELEMKVPESVVVSEVADVVTQAVKKWKKANERPASD